MSIMHSNFMLATIHSLFSEITSFTFNECTHDGKIGLTLSNPARFVSFVMVLRLLLIVATVMVAAMPLVAQFDVVQYDTDGIPPSVMKERRMRLLSTLPRQGLFVLMAADVRNRQNDVDYEYRQNSDLLYLTGFPHANATLLLSPTGIRLGSRIVHEILFVQERRREREQWTGVEMGPEEAQRLLGLDTALPATALASTLSSALAIADTVVLPSIPTRMVAVPLANSIMYIDAEMKKYLREQYPNLAVKVGWRPLAAMREVKDTHELRLMQKAIDISIIGHREAMARTKPGVHEYEIEAAMEYAFKRLGSEDPGYPSIVGSSYNACILHYTTNRRKTTDSDLILADCGAEYHGYTADITRTWPVRGTFTKEQREIYSIVLEAQDSGIVACRAGAAFSAPHMAAQAVIAKRLQELGIISSERDVRRYFMHGTSHYLGLDVHDAGTLGPLQPNTVLTVEPGIYIAAGSPCDPKWWNIGIRIEDDILVTSKGPVNLSAALPRAASDIEAMVGTAR